MADVNQNYLRAELKANAMKCNGVTYYFPDYPNMKEVETDLEAALDRAVELHARNRRCFIPSRYAAAA